MKIAVFILVTALAVLAHKFYQIRVPEEATDKFTVRILVLIFKLTSIKADIYGYLYGKEAQFDEWINSIRNPYSAKPERTEEGLKIRDTTLEGVPVRFFEPLAKEPNGPAVVFLHGGGWIVGSVEEYDSLCREWAHNLNMVIVSVEYRLAPDHPYPIPLQDCFDAAKYFLEHASEFEIDPNRIAIAGDSAGGTLTAAVSLKLRDTKVKPQPRLQVMLYPVTQAIDFNLPSYLTNADDSILSKEIMIRMWLMYAKGSTKGIEEAVQNKHVTKDVKSRMTNIVNHDIITGKKGSTPQPTEGVEETWNELKDVLLDPYFAPLMSEDLSDLPQALVYTVEQDVLKDEGILYTRRLKEFGNNVEHYHNKAGFHGLNSIAEREFGSKDSVVSNAKILLYIKRNL